MADPMILGSSDSSHTVCMSAIIRKESIAMVYATEEHSVIGRYGIETMAVISSTRVDIHVRGVGTRSFTKPYDSVELGRDFCRSWVMDCVRITCEGFGFEARGYILPSATDIMHGAYSPEAFQDKAYRMESITQERLRGQVGIPWRSGDDV